MNSKEKKIIDSVNSLSDDMIDFACRLVAEPSTLGNENSVLQVMEAELKKLDFNPVKVPFNDAKLSKHPGFAVVPWSYRDRYNLVAKKESNRTGGRSVLFNGHLDVVRAEPIENWDTDPFHPTIKDGKIYGRGSSDMKAGIAAMTYAVTALEKAGFGFRAPVTLEGVLEEECTGNGALACLLEGYNAEAVLIPESTGFKILTDQVGSFWFKVSVAGKGLHPLEVDSGISAFEKCYTLITALRKWEKKLNSGEFPGRFKGIKHPLKLIIGIVKAGDWPSMTPTKAEFHGRMAAFPGVSYKDFCLQLTNVLDAVVKKDKWLTDNRPVIEFYGMRSEGLSMNKDWPALATLNGCHKSLTKADAEDWVMGGTTDCRVFSQFGNTQATCYGPVGGQFHAENEWVDIESVIATARVYSLFLARWCGLTE